MKIASGASYFAFAVLLISFTIDSPRLSKPIEITDPAITKQFPVFGSSSSSLIIDWAAGPITPPLGLESYRVSLDAGYAHPYIVLYAFDHSNKQGYVYVPGREHESYRTNTSMILRGVEGSWFRASRPWEDLARPMIENQLVAK
jgi:hypothetical protein